MNTKIRKHWQTLYSHANPEIDKPPKEKNGNGFWYTFQFSRKTTAEHGHRLSNVFYVYKYIKSVSKLFGTHFTSPPSLVRLQFTNKGDFETWLNDLRPNERKLAASADLHFEYGLLYPDAAFLRMPYGTANSTFAVEIKPKQGWHIRQLPDDLLEMFDVNRDTIDKCRFCSMQFLKVKPKLTLSCNELALHFSVFFLYILCTRDEHVANRWMKGESRV